MHKAYFNKRKDGDGIMPAKKPYTTNSIIKHALRLVWLRSRERLAALRSTGYCCDKCGVKQSVAKGREVKIEVHHRAGIDWDGLCDLIRERLLHDPSRLQPLCKKCHDEETYALKHP